MFRSARGPMVWLVPLAVIILAAVLIGVVIVNQGPSEDSANAHSQSESGSGGESESGTEEVDLSFVEHRVEGDSHALGEVDAPVTLVMFSDYQCPYCASWNEETMPAMMDYVDKGDLRIEMRDLAVFGEESERAARAAYAAGLQGKYWKFHNTLFEGGEHPPKSELDDDSLVSTAKDLGLDPTKFKGDMNSVEAHEEFDATAQEGYSLGVASTPTFVIGGKPLVGAQPTKAFVGAVDEALAEAEG
ncbi:Protein-disulfide isomerase [Brevibacterium sandarakinum]|uniref:Protein-disulfide isomerase n=1 Tax=Brevibacterium sandarakinum TaxID=629680 RepID=A0A1H1USA6_BRESA|nr:thioredoxin domain-containing protein [Brevibacterium sandarakinum]SDS75357.1 Protein-disulfide isomerase [Brevibacterium sandarakinum]